MQQRSKGGYKSIRKPMAITATQGQLLAAMVISIFQKLCLVCLPVLRRYLSLASFRSEFL